MPGSGTVSPEGSSDWRPPSDVADGLSERQHQSASSAVKRVMIVGQPGSGKSWLAAEMGRITGLPVHHIDHIHWKSGWVERTTEEKTRLTREVHAQDAWIFEGGHSRTWGERLDRADTLIWLDFPLAVRYWRVIGRTIRHYGQTRPDLPEDCPERFSPEFLRWIWDTRRSGRVKMKEIFDTPPSHLTCLRFTRRWQVNEYVDKLRGLGAK
jgi:adenylate kinase family enzyme